MNVCNLNLVLSLETVPIKTEIVIIRVRIKRVAARDYSRASIVKEAVLIIKNPSAVDDQRVQNTRTDSFL